MTLKRKLALATMALAVSSVSFAGTYSAPACTSHAVTIPCEDSAWSVGFEAFWVQATSNNQNYAYTVNPAGNLITFEDVSPRYKFGFELNGSLRFSTGNDVTVRWERAHTGSEQDSLLVAADTVNVLSHFHINGSNFFNDALVAITGKVVASNGYEFDAVEAELGQHIDVGHDTDLRVHAGLQYARLEYTKGVRFNAAESVENILEMKSDVDAIGARVGADAAYNLGSGFGLVSHASGSLLVGDIESRLRALSTDTTAITEKEVVKFKNNSVVIPAAMLKTGINYSADMFEGHMSFEGGWRWEGFFDSIRFVPAAGGNFENFTFAGPYLAVSYVS